MSRALVLSNGELCVALDEYARVRDVYYPHVGLEDHTRGHYIHRVGVWIDGRLSYLGDDTAWQIVVGSADDSLEGRTTAKHAELGVELTLTDAVYNEKPLFVRRITVRNTGPAREIRLYIAHQFEIGKTHGGETAYFDPNEHAIVHYKGKRIFLIGALLDGKPFDDYATGRQGYQGKEGTHRDADDGVLSKNPIEHGQVDSAIGLYASYAAGQERTCLYWMAAAESVPQAIELQAYLAHKTPEHLLQSTGNFWRAWLSTYPRHYPELSPSEISLFTRSLLMVRAHLDRGGGVVASLDSDIIRYSFDTYSYVWPRDAAFAALALDMAGDTNASKRFFEFCRSVMTSDGYFQHKYLPDGSLGSSWHPLILDGRIQLPIQEDETALVVYALAEHYRHSRDLEFLESLYAPVIEKAAEFMLRYRDPATKLPLASYDLWEMKHATFTFTAASVVGALHAAATLALTLGKKEQATRYAIGAQEVREAIMTHLWDESRGCFLKSLDLTSGTPVRDETIDASSVYGVFLFRVLLPEDARLARAWETTVRRLSEGQTIGGLARFEYDDYYRSDSRAMGNPWVITTLWYAEYLIARAKHESDLGPVRDIFAWVGKRALASGALAEQFDPSTGAPLSATPLMWSHAAYATAVIKYLDKLEALGFCKDCNPIP